MPLSTDQKYAALKANPSMFFKTQKDHYISNSNNPHWTRRPSYSSRDWYSKPYNLGSSKRMDRIPELRPQGNLCLEAIAAQTRSVIRDDAQRLNAIQQLQLLLQALRSSLPDQATLADAQHAIQGLADNAFLNPIKQSIYQYFLVFAAFGAQLSPKDNHVLSSFLHHSLSSYFSELYAYADLSLRNLQFVEGEQAIPQFNRFFDDSYHLQINGIRETKESLLFSRQAALISGVITAVLGIYALSIAAVFSPAAAAVGLLLFLGGAIFLLATTIHAYRKSKQLQQQELALSDYQPPANPNAAVVPPAQNVAAEEEGVEDINLDDAPLLGGMANN